MNRTPELSRPVRIGFLGLLLAAPTAAGANVGIPMLVYAWRAAWMLLIPVIALEALVARRVLGATWPSSFKVAGLSNFLSSASGAFGPPTSVAGLGEPICCHTP